MRGHSILLTSALTLFAATACTYNYFEGTVNYRVYVPEIEQQLISNCHVAIYELSTGLLAAQSYAEGNNGDSEQTDLASGIFNFRLEEGEYKVCVFANIHNVSHNPGESLNDAHFALTQDLDCNGFTSPGNLLFDYIARPHDGVTEVVDTARIRPYPAEIEVRYRATLSDYDAVKGANLVIHNVAHKQHFAADTIPVIEENDSHAHYTFPQPAKYPIDADGAVFSFSTYLFPTAPESPLSLSLTLLDANGDGIISHDYRLYRDAKPIDLHCGDKAIIDIYNNGIIVGIIGWDETISGSVSDVAGTKPADPAPNI